MTINITQETLISDPLQEAFTRANAEPDWTKRLQYVAEATDDEIVFTTSFGLEDQAITHAIAEKGLSIRLATLDTGRMFPETYDLWVETEEKYAIKIHSFAPERAPIEQWVKLNGINAFRNSIQQRKECCAIRKVEPLKRALHGAKLWVTGLRADQSANRSSVGFSSFDAGFNLLKLSPVFDQSREQLKAFCEDNDVPVNRLHSRGFLSIGCAPCTRAIGPGEDERAGRWWWEQDNQKECGLHSQEVTDGGGI